MSKRRCQHAQFREILERKKSGTRYPSEIRLYESLIAEFDKLPDVAAELEKILTSEINRINYCNKIAMNSCVTGDELINPRPIVDEFSRGIEWALIKLKELSK